MIICSKYIEDKIDKAWFDSSNIIYGECLESDNEFKTVRLVFKNGTCYQYDNVHVSDWVSFKNAESQGKSLKPYFIQPKYDYQKLENRDLAQINEEKKIVLVENSVKEEDVSDDIQIKEYTILTDDDIVNYLNELIK